MEIKFNVIGSDRKQLVGIISEITGCKSEYQGMPSAAYKIGNIIINKEGTATFDGIEDDLIEKIIKAAKDSGLTPEADEAPAGLKISIPLDKVGVENLTNLLDAKESLIKKALGIDDISFIIEDDKVSFPWFTELPAPDEISAYSQFISALCKMSKKQKRINATQKETANEKYSFRCFLLRLGFIGDEYTQSRKILLKNLSGSSAFKNGQAKEVL